MQDHPFTPRGIGDTRCKFCMFALGAHPKGKPTEPVEAVVPIKLGDHVVGQATVRASENGFEIVASSISDPAVARWLSTPELPGLSIHSEPKEKQNGS